MEDWKAMRDALGLTMQQLADDVGHGRGSARLKRAVRQRLTRKDFSETENPGCEDRGVYGLRETETGAGEADLATRAACLAYLKKFLDTCETPDKVAWVKVELMEKFPLTKWTKNKP